MTTAELIYQRSRELPEAEAHSVLDFIEFLREKLRRNTAGQQQQAAVGMSGSGRFGTAHDDLDSLFGAWTEEEFSSVQGSVSAQRRIDPELWQ